jgi:hypothetical protein
MIYNTTTLSNEGNPSDQSIHGLDVLAKLRNQRDSIGTGQSDEFSRDTTEIGGAHPRRDSAITRS